MYCDYKQDDWASLLGMAEFSYNNSKHSATTMTPFYANYGFHPQMSLLPPSPSSSTPAADSYVHRLREAQVNLQRELLKAGKAMELSANRRRRPAPDLVQAKKCGCFVRISRPRARRPSWMFVVLGPTQSSGPSGDLPTSCWYRRP